MKNQMSFRTLEIVAVTLAVSAMAAGFIYWQMHSTEKVFASSEEEIAFRGVGEEIVSLRKDNTEVFKGKNGELNAKIYLAPKYYLDGGTYKKIDTSTHRLSALDKLNPLETKTYDSYIDAGVYRTEWFADKPWNYKFSVGDSWIQYKALFDESASLAIKVDTLDTGMKETVTLKDISAPTKLQWTVTESIGKSAIITPPPTAKDANGKDIKVISSQVGDILTYEVDTKGAVFPIEVDPTSITATSYGWIRNEGGTSFNTHRNATLGNATIGSWLIVGINVLGGNDWFVDRSFFSFVLPEMSAVSAAEIYLNGGVNYSDTDFNINIYTSTHTTPVNDDFDQFDGWQASGAYNGTLLTDTWNSVSWAAEWNHMHFNAAGLAAILAKQNSTFKVALVSAEDVADSAPSGAEVIYFGYGAGMEPYLSITYTAAVAPTVTTQDASSVTSTNATFNGNITATGGVGPTVRGFAYGTDSTLSTVIATTTDTTGQPFSTGAFTGAPNSALTCNTTYYSRAYATNSSGTGLGAISASFTTSGCTPVVTTQDPTDKNITSVTANGNITNIGGSSPTVRGFAYGTDPTLSTVISTTTDTNGQPFSTGAFTGAIASLIKGTTYYIRAYATNSTGTGLGSIKPFTTTIQSDVIIFGSNTVLGRDVILK